MSGGIDAVTLSTANEGRPISDQGVFALGLLWLSGMCLRITVLALPPVIPFLHADPIAVALTIPLILPLFDNSWASTSSSGRCRSSSPLYWSSLVRRGRRAPMATPRPDPVVARVAASADLAAR